MPIQEAFDPLGGAWLGVPVVLGQECCLGLLERSARGLNLRSSDRSRFASFLASVSGKSG